MRSSGNCRCAVLALLAGISLPCWSVPWVIQVRGTQGQPLADAVVAVELRGQPSRAAANASAQMAQRERRFDPHVLVVQTGTPVSFPNFDTVRHHVYSFSPTKKFDIKLYAGTPTEPIVFDKAGIATLGCNIHDRMSAHIVVVDTPVFGKTDAQGQLQLELPVGEHQVKTWHPGLAQAALQAQSLNVGSSAGQTQISLAVSP